MVSYVAIIIVAAVISFFLMELSKRLDKIVGNGYAHFLVFCISIAFLSELGIIISPDTIRPLFNLLFSFAVIGIFGDLFLMGVGFILYALALYHARKL